MLGDVKHEFLNRNRINITCTLNSNRFQDSHVLTVNEMKHGGMREEIYLDVLDVIKRLKNPNMIIILETRKNIYC